MTFIKWLFDTYNMLYYEYAGLPEYKRKEILTEYKIYKAGEQLKGSYG